MKTKKFIYLTVLITIGLITINSYNKDDDCAQQTWYQDAGNDDGDASTLDICKNGICKHYLICSKTCVDIGGGNFVCQ